MINSYFLILKLFKRYRFPKKYISDLSMSISIMFLTKDVIKFTFFLDILLKSLNRVEQKNFFFIFSSISIISIESIFIKYGICGFLLKASGKIGGYAGDKTKLFLVKYGKNSKSKRLYKYNFFQKFIDTKPGTIGLNILLSFL